MRDLPRIFVPKFPKLLRTSLKLQLTPEVPGCRFRRWIASFPGLHLDRTCLPKLCFVQRFSPLVFALKTAPPRSATSSARALPSATRERGRTPPNRIPAILPKNLRILSVLSARPPLQLLPEIPEITPHPPRPIETSLFCVSSLSYLCSVKKPSPALRPEIPETPLPGATPLPRIPLSAFPETSVSPASSVRDLPCTSSRNSRNYLG